MENVNRWYFTKDQLASTPSRKNGIDTNKELSYRQQAANFIQDMGQRLQVSQLCINTAIVYMHRFYYFHSFSEVHRNSLSVAALFLAAKVEEQPRKLEHVIKVAHVCLHKDTPPLDVRTEAYAEKQYEVVAHENTLLQTLGFVLAIEHPHTYVVKVCQLVKASKDLAQTSYFMATTSLHMTTMCLQYRPTVVACVCIHLACKWSSWKIEPCSEGKEWYYYVDKSVTLELLETLTQEFIAILETSPHRFKRKFIAQKDGSYHGAKSLLDESPSLGKHHSLSSESKIGLAKKDTSSPGPSSSISFQFCSDIEEKTSVKVDISEKPAVSAMQSSPSKKVKAEPVHSISLAIYREKREKERLENKTLPVESTHQPGISKPQHAFNEHEKVLPKTVAKPMEHTSHTAKEKGNKISAAKEPQVHPTSVNKINHQLLKTGSESAHVKENKSNVNPVKSSNVSNDPVVLLKRVDMKAECKDSVPDSEVQTSSLQHFPTDKLPISVDHKYDILNENSSDSKEGLISVIKVETPQIVKTKHQKHKVNSVHNSHSNIQMLPHRQSPSKDIKTNGSKESGDIDKRSQSIVENNIGSSRSSDGSSTTSKHDGSSSKHEKREKHRNKHSAHSSKDKSVNNHSEHSTPGIKVKIRKDIICLPESSQKSQPVVKSEGQKKSLKIKISKPSLQEPAKAMKGNNPSPIKLVITKDKSGSGSYSTSHKNDHESRKRVHSPASQEANSKNFYEPSSKYTKVDHSYKAHHTADGPGVVIKQSKSVRHSAQRSNVELQHSANDISAARLQHSVNDSTVYNNVEIGGRGQPFFHQYYPYHVAPPPPPPPLPSLMLRGHGPSLGKTNSNPPLPPPLPPQPPPPPE